MSREVIDHAAEIRAKYGFRTPDAIHLAAAVVSSCDVFLTNHHRLDRFTDITKSCQDAPLLAVGRNGILGRGFGGQIPPT